MLKKVAVCFILLLSAVFLYGCPTIVVPTPNGIEVFGWGRSKWLEEKRRASEKRLKEIKEEKLEGEQFLKENTPVIKTKIGSVLSRLSLNTDRNQNDFTLAKECLLSIKDEAAYKASFKTYRGNAETFGKLPGITFVKDEINVSAWVLYYPWDASSEYKRVRYWESPEYYPQILLLLRGTEGVVLVFRYDKGGQLKVISVEYKNRPVFLIHYDGFRIWGAYHESPYSYSNPSWDHPFSAKEKEALQKLGEYMLAEIVSLSKCP